MEELIVSVLSGAATERELSLLLRWRNESPENERLFQEYAATWQVLQHHESQGPVPAPPKLERIVSGGDRRRQKAIPLRPISNRRPSGWWWVTAAAAAVAAIAVGLPLVRTRPPELDLATGHGETRTISLEDGSVVRLGPDSRLAFRNGTIRRANVAGVAFFAVAPDSSAPFRIRTDAGTVEVLGTRFEVRASADSLRLVVVEGRVTLTAAKQRVLVAGGEMARMTRGAPPSLPQAVRVWDLLDWQDGLLIFRDTPLRVVVAELERHFGVPFSIADARLAERVVTAWFEDEPFDDVVGTICKVVAATCMVGDRVVMRP
jgi:transmembrane sensor